MPLGDLQGSVQWFGQGLGHVWGFHLRFRLRVLVYHLNLVGLLVRGEPHSVEVVLRIVIRLVAFLCKLLAQLLVYR